MGVTSCLLSRTRTMAIGENVGKEVKHVTEVLKANGYHVHKFEKATIQAGPGTMALSVLEKSHSSAAMRAKHLCRPLCCVYPLVASAHTLPAEPTAVHNPKKVSNPILDVILCCLFCF